jgi:two-component system cell cycle response regulator
VKILAAEDNPVFQTMLRGMLTKWGYEVIIAKDGHEALQALEGEDAPRLALLDWMMPGLDGVDVCRRVRSKGREPYIYILLLTARTDSEDLVTGMDAGADDYLTKPFNAPELRARLRAGQRILDLQEQLLEAREALRQEATHDALTGLLNRRAILGVLEIELERASRENLPLAVLMADLDHFKQVNDQWGHQAGDSVLHEGAERMRSSVRVYDSVGRYGGEEFLIVLPGCVAEGATAQAERLRQAFSSQPFSYAGETFPVTVSVGICCRASAPSVNTDTLIREADLCLYAAKEQGRNRIVCSSVEALSIH